MPELKTKYLGLELKNPLIVGSSGLTDSTESIVKLEEAGAGAVVIKSIFEEEIMYEMDETLRNAPDIGYKVEAFDNYDFKIKADNIARYYQLINEAKQKVDIPIIASINCVSTHEWPYYAKKFEEAGADALELNVFTLPSDQNRTPAKVEKSHFDLIEKIKENTSLPISLKMSYYFANLGSMIQRLSETDIEGLVLFNRYYSPDFDIEKMKFTHGHILSSPEELYLSLRWVAMMSQRVRCDLAASTGIHDEVAMIKQLLAGATAVQVVSAIYKKDPAVISMMLAKMGEWMDRHGFTRIDDFRGKLSQQNSEDPAAYERVQFMKYFRGFESVI